MSNQPDIHRRANAPDGSTPVNDNDLPLMVSDAGVVLLATGPERAPTKSLRKLMAKSKKGQAREDFRFYRDYLQMAGRDPRGPLQFVNEPYEDGVARIRDALAAAGLKVTKQANLSNSYDVEVEKGFANYRGRYARRIRVLYQQLIDDKVRTDKANPAEIVDWHLMNAAERTRVADLTIASPYGRDYAGALFVVKGRQKHHGRPENPEGVGEEMTAAIVTGDAPEVVKVMSHVFEDASPRVMSMLPASGLGWSMGGFGDTLYVTRKWGGPKPDLPLPLTADVQRWLMTRFEGLPHPLDPARTMMDRMRELAAAGDEDGLATIYLFTSDVTGRPLSPSGLRYWWQDAMLAEGVRMGSRTATPHNHRNVRMHAKVTQILRETSPGAERERRLADAGEEFGHKSAAWKSYVQFALAEEGRRVQRARAEQLQREAAARRAGAPPPPRSIQLASPAAEALHSRLPKLSLG